jgi:hypothetical protein
MKETIFVFIYKRDEEVKVLTYDQAWKEHKELISFGWKHIQTLDAIQYIKYQFEHNEKD